MSRTIYGVIAFLIFAGFAIVWFFPRLRPPENEVLALCSGVLPHNENLGLKFGSKDNQIDIDIGAVRSVDSTATAAHLDAFIKCLEAAGKEVKVVNGVTLPIEPIGQVANRWEHENGLKIALLPGINPEIINNLRIGPAAGTKFEVMRAWCSPAQAGNCVICEPNDLQDSTPQVIVRLRADNSPVDKVQMPGTWQAPQQGIPNAAWQIVDAQGRRFFYECQRKKK
jgi:hypothetical protein